jgi:uncharacterized protein (UPF0332 family)
MTPEQQLLQQKARRALEAAQASLVRRDAETAVNRAYYAAFYVATAWAHQMGETPRTHKGLHLLWNRHLRDQLPPHLATFLSYAFQIRQRADYDAATVFDLGAAADLVRDAVQFVEAVENLLT